MQRRLSSLLLILVAAGIYRPDLVPVPQVQGYFQQAHDWVLQRFESTEVSEEYSNDHGLVKGIQDSLIPTIRHMSVPSYVSGMPEEVIVDEYVSHLTGELAQLPAEQFERIQVAFCEDLLKEATESGEGR